MLRKLIATMAVVISALAASTAANAAQYYTLQSVQSGKYVASAGGYLAANQPSAKTALRFDMVRVQSSQVAFRDRKSGKYLRAGVGQGAFLAVASARVGSWEIFHMRTNGGTFTLRSAQNGKYVRAGVGNGSLLAAVSDRAAGWETFRLVRVIVSDNARAPQQPQRGNNGFELAGNWRLSVLRNNAGRLEELGGNASRATRMNINRRGKVSGNGGCNSFDTSVEQTSRAAVRFSNVISTKMRCGGATDTYERVLFNAFAASRYFARDNRHLYLYDRNGQEIARFIGG
ncbi:MAG: META domain-containing protein [Tepidamorphaceae bacterium]|nr:META domain-containing protein [Rhodobiaceae bacterium]MCC0049583.1 META domain-containing protein [Rhodobiaceae bacterium]